MTHAYPPSCKISCPVTFSVGTPGRCPVGTKFEAVTEAFKFLGNPQSSTNLKFKPDLKSGG